MLATAAALLLAEGFQQLPEYTTLLPFHAGSACVLLCAPPLRLLQSSVSHAHGWGCPYTGGQGGVYPKPPPHFICNRCNIPGHWKRDCPTKDDPAYDPKKAPVGIPMSRTKIITEEEAAASSEGVMKLQDGRYVQCMPSEYVQSLVVHPLISSVSFSVCCAQKSFCESSVSVMIQYSTLSRRRVLVLRPCLLPRCTCCVSVCS